MPTVNLIPRQRARLIPRLTVKKPGLTKQFGAELLGNIEGALATATGFSEFLGQAIPGAVGLGKLAVSKGDIDATTETIRQWQENIQPYFRYTPKTQKGKQTQERIAKFLDWVIGRPSRELGGLAQRGIDPIAGETAGAVAGTITEIGAGLAGYGALLGLLKAPLTSKTKLKEGRPLTERDVIEFEKHLKETEIFAKAQSLKQSDIMEALRGRPSSPEAVAYIKVLTAKERAAFVRETLKKKEVKLIPREEVPIERGVAIPEKAEGPATLVPRKQAPIESKLPREKEVRVPPDSKAFGELAETVTPERVGPVALVPSIPKQINLLNEAVSAKNPEDIASVLDIEYNGEGEGLHFFTDKVTGSTLADTELEEVFHKLQEMRETFAEQAPPEEATNIRKVVEELNTAMGEEQVATETIDVHSGLPLTQLIPKTWMPKWAEFWIPFSSIPNTKDVLLRRYRQFGDIDKATRTVTMVYDRLKKYSPETNKEIFTYLDGRLDLLDLPLEARHDANRIRTLIKKIGKKLVDENIISQATFDAHPNYVHYMFARHIVGEEGALGIGPTGKLNLSYTIARNPNLTREDRQALGLIEDASVAVPVGIGKALVDIAKKRYLRDLSVDPNVTWQPSIITLPDGRKMGIGKLSREVEAMGRVVEQSPTPETQALLDVLKEALDTAIEETKNLPEGFKQLPSDKFYGPLAGAFVRKAVADDIMPLFSSIAGTHRGEGIKTLLKIEAEGMALFKVTHVALNFPTAFRNVVSNVIQNNMRGRSLAKIPGDFVKAGQSMKAKDIHFIEARKHGLFRTNWAVTEISEVLDEFMKVDSGSWHTFLNALKTAAKYYGKIDDWAKHAIYVQMRNEGVDIPTAVLEAQKWGMDYSLASRSVKELRRHIIPFVTYQYKIAPLIYESVARNPLIIGKYAAAMALAIPFIVKAMHDIGDDEWDKMESQIPRYIRKTGSPMILPWKDKEGRWQWVNMEYYFPWGNWLNIYRDLRSADFSELARDSGIGNPFLDILSALKSGIGGKPPKDPYSGIPIYNELDTEVTKRLKLLEYLYNKWAPSMLTEYGALGYSVKVGEKDRWGKTATLSQAIGRWFGFNIVAADKRQSNAIKAHRIKEITKDFIRIKTDPTISKKEKKRAFEFLKKKRKEIIAGKD